jgi:hypothetical protein
VLLVFVEQRVTSPARLVLQGRGVVVLGISLDPDVDTLPGYSEHAGNVSSGATMVELQDGEGTPKHASVTSLRELTPETLSLPGSQIEPAHGLILHC